MKRRRAVRAGDAAAEPATTTRKTSDEGMSRQSVRCAWTKGTALEQESLPFLAVLLPEWKHTCEFRIGNSLSASEAALRMKGM